MVLASLGKLFYFMSLCLVFRPIEDPCTYLPLTDQTCPDFWSCLSCLYCLSCLSSNFFALSYFSLSHFAWQKFASFACLNQLLPLLLSFLLICVNVIVSPAFLFFLSMPQIFSPIKAHAPLIEWKLLQTKCPTMISRLNRYAKWLLSTGWKVG